MLTQQRLTGSDQEIAITHETNRQSTVKSILVHTFFLAKFGYLQGTLTAKAASAQYLMATGPNNAAHCTPAQILCGGRTLQSLITNSDSLDLEIENLFGTTDIIPRKFNLADSRAEENGLCDALAAACNAIANTGRTMRFGQVEQIHPKLEEAYRIYKNQGQMAIRNAIARQNTMMNDGAQLKGVTRQEIVDILNTYNDTLRTSMDTHETVQMLFTKDIWQDYAGLR